MICSRFWVSLVIVATEVQQAAVLPDLFRLLSEELLRLRVWTVYLPLKWWFNGIIMVI